MSKEFHAKRHISKLNIFKYSLGGQEINDQQLIAGFRECRLPVHPIFIREFKKSSLIEIRTADKMVFTSTKNPIYYKDLRKIYDAYYKQVYKKEPVFGD